MNDSNEFEFSRFKESLFIIISDLKNKRKNVVQYKNEIDNLLNESLILKCKSLDSTNETCAFHHEILKNEECIQYNNFIKSEYECKIQQFNEILTKRKENLHSIQMDNYKQKSIISNLEEEKNQLKSQNEILSKGMLKLKEFVMEIYQKIEQMEKFLHNINLQIQESKSYADKYDTLTLHYQCLIRNSEDKSKDDELMKVAQMRKIDNLIFQIKKLSLTKETIVKKDDLCIKRNWEHFGLIVDDNISIIENALLSNVSRFQLMDFKHDDEELCDLSPLCFWGQVYRHAYGLKHNWEQGKYTVQSIFINSYSGESISAICSNNDTLAVTTSSNKLILYKLHTFIFLSEFQQQHHITCLAMISEHVVVGLDNGNIILVYMPNFLSRYELINENCSVESIQCVGDYICALHSNYRISVWSYSTKILLCTLTGHTDDIFCYTPFDDKWLVTGGWDCDTFLWDLENYFAAVCFSGHEEAVSCVKMDRKHIVTGSFDGTVRIWNWEMAILENTLLASKEIYCLELTETKIIAGGSDSHIYIWKWNGDLIFKLPGHLGIVRYIKYLDNGRLISAGDMRRIMIWNIDNGSCLSVLHRNPCQIGKILINDYCVIVASDCSNSHFYVLSFL